MRFGMNVPIFGEYADVRLLAEMAVEAEASGWDGFWVWDHVHWSGENDGEPRQPTVDPVVALTMIGAATRRIRFGPMILPLARRRPWKVARELATLDHLSGGRLTVGVGLGAPAGLEFGDFGEPTDARVRAARLDEGLEVMAGLWTGQPFHFSGEHYRVTRAEMLPRPVQDPIPVWVGGEWPNRAPFRRAARFAGAHPMLAGVPLDDQPAAIRDLVDYIGRFRSRDQPFDVAYGVDTAGDGGEADRSLVSGFAEAGVTWWMEPISQWRGPLTEIRDRIRRGPPVLATT